MTIRFVTKFGTQIELEDELDDNIAITSWLDKKFAEKNLTFDSDLTVVIDLYTEILNLMIAEYRERAFAPWYAYIPLIGKKIVEDKVLPFDAIKTIWYFPDVAKAYGRQFIGITNYLGQYEVAEKKALDFTG